MDVFLTFYVRSIYILFSGGILNLPQRWIKGNYNRVRSIIYLHTYKCVDLSLHFIGSSANWTGLCDAGYYCENGAWTSTPIDGVRGRPCPKGSFCLEGTIAPEGCPTGTFNNITGLTASSECTSCLPGKVCSTTGLEAPNGLCQERYYCAQGAKTATPSDPSIGGKCTPGHYCPTGVADPLSCKVKSVI